MTAPEIPAARPGNRLTVAIATYDGRELLERALPSLAAQRFRDFRVLVVDDGSSDGTAQWLAERWPAVEVLAQPNRGVTAALNTCLRASRDTELVGLFNNDVELDPDCLGELVAALDEHPEAGSAGPKLLDLNRPGVIDGAGDVLTWAGHGHRRGHGEPDRGQYDEPQAIFGPCGGAAVYRRSALEVVGELDEDFHAFFEDVDWALRAQLAGFQCRYVPAAVVHHVGSATLGAGLTDFTRYHLWRNAVWVLAKGMPASLLARHAHQLLAGQLVNLAVAVRDRKLDIWARAWRDAIAGLPRMLTRRRRIQRARRISPRELERRLSRNSARSPAAG
ncbi:MAG TPA: glycosyltransferase family 2 protein [Solirubrobacteraceae bacterium]|nr:glycosyltransferase family 2 protein [Solirubrobacteraceae bacterium]